MPVAREPWNLSSGSVPSTAFLCQSSSLYTKQHVPKIRGDSVKPQMLMKRQDDSKFHDIPVEPDGRKWHYLGVDWDDRIGADWGDHAQGAN
jgi:hypothetical protein